MTRKEAIQVLRDWDGYFIGHSSDYVNEALNMAIKALEQENILDKIRAEIDQYLFQNEFGSAYRKEVSQIIDKYKTESEEG